MGRGGHVLASGMPTGAAPPGSAPQRPGPRQCECSDLAAAVAPASLIHASYPCSAAARVPQGAIPPRLYTVGRLDVASVGLIFVTNDGDWAHK